VARVFVVAGTCLLSRYVTTILGDRKQGYLVNLFSFKIRKVSYIGNFESGNGAFHYPTHVTASLGFGSGVDTLFEISVARTLAKPSPIKTASY
jgi:hypothetical protein